MKLTIRDAKNGEKGTIDMPAQFQESVRPDLIKRAVLTIQANKRQPYGSDKDAGMKYSAELSRRRRKYRGSYGKGISRVPRKIMTRRGTQMYMVGAVAPGTVGGRRAHPPKMSKQWNLSLNKKERQKAIRSALASTLHKAYVTERGHKVPNTYPFALDSDFEKMNKTKDLEGAFKSLGLQQELDRTSVKREKSGKAALRGRKYRCAVGPLLVVSKVCKLQQAAANLPGVEVVLVDQLNTEQLAPGAVPGRLLLFTKAALERLGKEKLYTAERVREEKQ